MGATYEIVATDGMKQTIVMPDAPEVVIEVPGKQGPSGMQVVQHGTDANVARPAGVPLVYWVGTAKPVNAMPYDMWDNG